MAAVALKPLSKSDFISIGRLYGSHLVALEASEAAARWLRDAAVLASYGHGAKQLEKFKVLVTQHRLLMEGRPDSVATKRSTVATKDADYRAGQRWIDQAVCILKQAAQSDEKLAMRLYEAVPEEDVGELPARIVALKTLLTDAKALVPEDAEVDARIDEADGLVKKLSEAPGTVSTAKAAKIGDTAELDYLDGQVIVAIRNLNEAANKAIRNDALEAPASEYRFNHLRRSRRSPQQPVVPSPAPAEPVK